MRALGAEADTPARAYFTGGATAVLLGWRATTIDVDVRFVPENDRVFRAIPALKERLELNVEFASPADFIPELPGWEGRCIFISQEGAIAFLHYDLYSQALAKIERRHAQDLADVREMVSRGLIEPAAALALFREIEPRLYRYPAVDPASFGRAVREIMGGVGQ